jgi:FtsH-binding integral membrane protein
MFEFIDNHPFYIVCFFSLVYMIILHRKINNVKHKKHLKEIEEKKRKKALKA